MWFEKSVLYHIYPFGFCGVPERKGEETECRISKVSDWIPHMSRLGVDALYLGPIFESDRHGYDTRDYRRIDGRLGENDDFAEVCEELHRAGIYVILDGVFNHVGRGFWAFKDIQENRENSKYRDWFSVNFGGDSPYGDGFWYEGWEGHYELVKLNLRNEEVIQHIFSCVRDWIGEFGIDGIRLDVAYMLDRDFIRRLSRFVKGIRPDFFLLGEIIHGDYNEIVGEDKLDSCTNYECYKGLYSSFNSLNMFEIAHSLNRQFGPEHWTLYRDKHLVIFADNHDVDRIASTLTKPEHLPLLYGLMFAMPGIPCIYYGSEWGAKGKKQGGDDNPLRPSFDEPVSNDLTKIVSIFAEIHRREEALIYGTYKQIALNNGQIIFLRDYRGQRIFVAINAADTSAVLYSHEMNFSGENLLTGEVRTFSNGMELPKLSVSYWKVK